MCEALARSGVGALDLIDKDRVALSNVNRQIIATQKTVGKYKTDVMRERILDINPQAQVRVHPCFMGAGNKLDATAFRVADLYETRVCPLARVMRRELKKRNVEHLKVVYSEEEPMKPEISSDDGRENGGGEETCSDTARRQTPGSTAFVPSVAGLIIAGEVVKDLAGMNGSMVNH